MATSSDNHKDNPKAKPLHLVRDFSKSKLGFWHYFSMFVWLGWFLFFFTLPVTLIVLYMYSMTAFTVMLGLLATSALYPIKWKLQPRICYAFGRFLIRHAAEYLRLQVYAEDYDAILAAKPALFGLEPHDILPISLIALGDMLKTIPGHKLRGALTSACFQAPGMRHIYTWATAVSVDKKSLRRLLSKQFSLCICPGGAHEVTFMRHSSDPETVLYLKNRLGLPRLAAEQPNGLHIIPCFCFNQRPTYDFLVPNIPLLHKLGRKVGFIPLFFTGVFGIPFGPPKSPPPSAPLVFVMGKPLYVPHIASDDPTRDERLKEIQVTFVSEMQRIYDTYAPQYDARYIDAVQNNGVKPTLTIL